MKLYVFKYDSYGLSYATMAETSEDALRTVKKIIEGKGWDGEGWKDALLDNLPEGYSLMVMDVNEVYITERC